jgi:hypothetical protein
MLFKLTPRRVVKVVVSASLVTTAPSKLRFLFPAHLEPTEAPLVPLPRLIVSRALLATTVKATAPRPTQCATKVGTVRSLAASVSLPQLHGTASTVWRRFAQSATAALAEKNSPALAPTKTKSARMLARLAQLVSNAPPLS